jgi:hypothetical protein
MRTLRHITILISAICCCSCYSYRIPKEYRKLENHNSKRSAYVTNKSLKKEFRILANSQLFTIVDDSVNADLKIRLYPIKRHTGCGQAGVISMLTIGQMPVVYQDFYSYHFDEIEKEKITERKLGFGITQRVWFWDMFSFNKRFEEKAGKVVLGTYKTAN